MASADDLKADGNRAFGAQKYQEAAEIYGKALNLKPIPVLYSNRAQCYINLKQWNKALQDVEDGLKLGPEDKLKVKLLYRGGIICQNLSHLEQATIFLQTALDIDASNKPVIELLEKIRSNKKAKIAKNEELTEIPIETCDSLPIEFQAILDPTLKVQIPTASAQVSDEIDELFPRKQTSPVAEEPKQSQATTSHSSSVDQPVMFPLAHLKNVPSHQKENSYKFILSQPTSTFQGLFLKGFEPEFLKFFIEAALYASNHNIIQDWPNQVLLHLQQFYKYPGFDLHLQFCEQQHIQQLLEAVDKLEQNALSRKYHTILDNFIC